MDGRFVARYYVLHATCFTDILATIPAWIEVSSHHLCNLSHDH